MMLPDIRCPGASNLYIACSYLWTMNPSMSSRQNLRNIVSTVHGGQAWKLGGIEDYSHNLNPFGPPSDIKQIIASSAEGIDHYPDDSCSELKEAISERFNVNKDSIIIGAGSSDIIRMFPNTFLEKGDRVIIPKPSFAEYTQQCLIAGAKVIREDLSSENNFHIDFEKLKSETDSGVKAVYICNPNNPTGRTEKPEDIIDFTEYCADRGTFVFLDETLLELVRSHDEISCVKYAEKYPNLLIVGSLTKSFAIPGIRIGFGFADSDIIKELNKVRMTWNVGQIEQKVAAVLIRDRTEHVERASEVLSEEAKWMYSHLKDIGFPVTMTDSFFFFDSVAPLGITGHEFAERMKKNGIAVRECASFGSEFADYVRFCVKDRLRNERFVQAVKNSLR